MKKLLVVLGAGASLETNMPSVKDIDKLFNDWANTSYSLNNNKSQNLYKWIKETVNDYYTKLNPNNYTPEQNFETILYTIQTLSTLSDESNEDFKYNKGLKAFIEIKEFPEINRYFNDIVIPDASEFQRLQAYLTDKLLHHIRKKCATLEDDKKEEILKIRSFFNLLKQDYEIGFINLNYDNVILTALPDLTTGYNKTTGEFDKNQFYDDKWNFCYHLHGSVYFDMQNKGIKPHTITWNNDLNSDFDTTSIHRNVDFTSEGNYYLNSTIITGLDKANQILREPFGQYYMKVDKLIHESDSILFIGYGFGDLHLNKLFPAHRVNPTKKRQVVVIDYFSEQTDPLYKRSDSWAHRLSETILFYSGEMGNGSEYYLPENIVDYKNTNTFEFSRNDKYPLSIWHNGFLSACENAEIIKKELLK